MGISNRSVILVGATALCVGLFLSRRGRGRGRKRRGGVAYVEVERRLRSTYASAIGNTPLIRLETLSERTGRTIYAKMECGNPGGTGKDRAVWSMLQAAGPLPPGSTVVEGTSGSTGISLAFLCRSLGYRCVLFVPDDQAVEKVLLLKTLGATVHVTRNCAIANPEHYVNRARREAERTGALFLNQFENRANADAHFTGTGPELLRQMKELGNSHIDAFVMSCGTGGTLAGVGHYLKRSSSSSKPTEVVLVDPPGSALHHRVTHGVAYAPQQSERALRKHRYDTLAEGIGIDRITQNLAWALDDYDCEGNDLIDRSFCVEDQEAVDMAHWLLREEGLFVGSSSAMNVVGAVRTANSLPPNSNVVTIICDTGQRHLTRFWNQEFIKGRGLQWPESDTIPQCLLNLDQDKTAQSHISHKSQNTSTCLDTQNSIQ